MKRTRKRKYTLLGHVRDVEGGSWDVYEIRDTKHGFDLLFGFPEERGRRMNWGPPRLIATAELVAYWETVVPRHDNVIFDLPAGRTTMKRVRRRLGFHYDRDKVKFFEARKDDLLSLTAREFSKRHNLRPHVAADARHLLYGRTARELDWWQTPETTHILASSVPLRVAGERLGISISQAHRLRKRARKALESGFAAQPEAAEPQATDLPSSAGMVEVRDAAPQLSPAA